jgi:hypothetical protein
MGSFEELQMVPRSPAFVRAIALTLTAITVAGPTIWAKGP